MEKKESKGIWAQLQEGTVYTYQEAMEMLKDKIPMSSMMYTLKPFKEDAQKDTTSTEYSTTEKE